MNKQILCCLWISFLALVGCSVKQERVQNNPPVIKKGIKRFDASFGTFQIKQASFFLWPDGLTEEQAQELVKKVNAASLEVDEKMLAAGLIQREIALAQAAWVEQDCVAKWSAEYDDIEESVISWKTSENPEEQKLIQACADNQQKRLALRDEIGPIAARIGMLSELIDRAVDPDAAKIENKKGAAIDTNASYLEISEPVEAGSEMKVALKIVGLFKSGSTFSTADGSISSASYSLERRLLSFAVAEHDQEMKPTGHMYQIVMERAPDINGMARFQGDIRVFAGEKLVRYGSVRFDAVPPEKKN